MLEIPWEALLKLDRQRENHQKALSRSFIGHHRNFLTLIADVKRIFGGAMSLSCWKAREVALQRNKETCGRRHGVGESRPPLRTNKPGPVLKSLESAARSHLQPKNLVPG